MATDPKDPNPVELDQIREQINTLDTEIHALFNRRAELAREAGRSKGQLEEVAGSAVDYYRPEREAQVLREALARNTGPLTDEQLAGLFRKMMSACLAQQEPMTIAYLGPEGTFSQAAVHKQFGRAVTGLPVSSIEQVFRDVESGLADYGVVPVENSTEGGVGITLDMLGGTDLKISSEIELPIRQHLLAGTDDLKKIKRVYSHQQSLAQCRDWLDRYLPEAERISLYSNAEGARRVTKDASAAAIAGRIAAEVYGLQVVVEGIEDRPDNTTRFLLIGHYQPEPTGRDKTSMILSSGHVAGALYHVMEPLVRHGINLTRLESRPSRRGKWDYVFFIDAEGHREDAELSKALGELEKSHALLRVLGSYPRAIA